MIEAALYPLAPAFAAAGISAFSRYWKREKGDDLSPDQIPILTPLDARRNQLELHHSNEMIAVLGGTFGVRAGARFFNEMYNAGNDHFTSSIVVIEPSVVWRNWLRDNIPPIYLPRIVWGHPTHRGSGYDGETHETTIDDVDHWGPPALDGALLAIQQHMLRNGNRFPGLVVAFLGEGGSTLLSSLALQPFKEKFNCKILAITALPEFEELRNRFPKMKRWYERFGVDFWLPIDNLQANVANMDRATVLLVLGLMKSADHSDAAQAITNLLNLASAHRKGSVFLVQALTQKLAAFPYSKRPDGELGWWTQRPVVHDQILSTSKNLAKGHGHWSVEVPVDPDLPFVDLVLVPFFPNDLIQTGDALQRARWIRARTLDAWENDRSPNGHVYRRSNYAQLFAALPEVITEPATAQLSITALRLTVAKGDGKLAEEIAKTPQQRATEGPKVKPRTPAFVAVARGTKNESAVSS